jgi:NADH dehydrogenase
VVVIGGGFGGLTATRSLRKAPVQVTLIDRHGHHLFQPLLYQVATGILSEGEIARPLRDVLRRQRNATVLLGEVDTIDLENRTVTSHALGSSVVTPYDSLVVAAGASYSYFGNDQFADLAPGLKSIDDALRIRSRIFTAFELADRAEDASIREQHLTFAVIGGGPTGIELAGQIRDLARHSLRDNYDHIDPAAARVVLLEAADTLLPTYRRRLSLDALSALTRVGVDVRLGAKVVRVEPDGVVYVQEGREVWLPATAKVWAAGVAAAPVAGLLAAQATVERNRAGQLVLMPDCTLPGHPEVFVVGDLMSIPGVPGVAQLAIQSGRFAARVIRDRQGGTSAATTFAYRDKGSLATIARFRAVADLPHLKLNGLLAWLLWLGVHLVTLMGFGRRLSVTLRWTFAFILARRPERIGTPLQADWPAVTLAAPPQPPLSSSGKDAPCLTTSTPH